MAIKFSYDGRKRVCASILNKSTDSDEAQTTVD